MTTKVFLDYDQDALDRAYNQAAYAPNMQQVGGRIAQRSAEARKHLGEPKRLAYGLTTHQRLDLYPAHVGGAPIVVYVHGGAWRNGSAAVSAAPAEMFVAAGANYIALDFILIEEAEGDLLRMIEQVRRAIAWVYANARSFGADPQRIYLAGHSSGSHLGACALITDWPHDFAVPADVIKAACLSSGMYDLFPVSLSARSGYVRFTPEMIELLSPIRHLDRLATPLTIACGTFETPEFQRQAHEFAAAATKAGKDVDLIVAEGYNHPEMQETLANPFGIMGRAALTRFGLTRSAAQSN